MKTINRLVLVPPLLAFLGCATLPQSTLLGAAVGGTAGGVGGYYASEHSSTVTLLGVLTGAVVGGTLGLLLHKPKSETPAKTDSEIHSENVPNITRPIIHSYKVPAHVEGNKYIEEHLVHIIDKGTTWSLEDER